MQQWGGDGVNELVDQDSDDDQMEPVQGDDYLRRIATFIRLNEKGLAEAAFKRRRRPRSTPQSSVFNPVGWFMPTDARQPSPRPVTFVIDTHRLFYALIRIESIGIDVGSLDVTVDNPSKPMHYTHIHIGSTPDKSETLSLASFRSSLSAVSGLSLGTSWWGQPEPQSIDAELKYIYSSFTKIPALLIKAPGPKVIAEMKDDPPSRSAIPLDAFKNIQTLETIDIDPRTLIGWDRLADTLRSLTIKRSGLEDVADIFIGAVLDDQARRDGSFKHQRSRYIPCRQRSWTNTPLPASVPEDGEEVVKSMSPSTSALSPYKWGLLKHLSLSDNALTFLPTDPLPYLVSVTHLDLSSNLLVSVPHGLSVLHNLVSLNLADNMIDSVLGVYTHLGQVLYLNLSRNRLESICGLERLMALERVDLRFNHIDESAEIGRLATLPNIGEVWIEGNPLTEIEDNHRVACFEFFHKEGKSISLDGSAPTFYERRGLMPVAVEELHSAKEVPMPASPPTVPIGVAKTKPYGMGTEVARASLAGKKRKAKRIVDLNGDGVPMGHVARVQMERSSSISPQRPSTLSSDGHRRTYSAIEPQEREGELYRARIEALRSDMGDGWLKVFSQAVEGDRGP